MRVLNIVMAISIIMASCTGKTEGNRVKNKQETMAIERTKQYGYNRDFLKQYSKIIELRNGNSAIAVVPAWQGRVMTSTSEGDSGFSFGWINHELIASGEIKPHINAFGGEERLWLGPEGGQFSLFFKKGKSFVFEDWQTPAFIDTDPYELINSNDTSLLFTHDVETENYNGTEFRFRLEREIVLLSAERTKAETGIAVEGLNCVAYLTENKIINKGEKQWVKETGLLSVWMLGMYNPAPSVIVVIPIKPGDENVLGPKVNDNYFGKISPDRLAVKGDHVFLKADGRSRGKIGIPPLRATGTMGSYDSENKILTLLLCRLPEGKNEYVNSAWEIQKNPYSGDALNSYNDGPLEDGS